MHQITKRSSGSKNLKKTDKEIVLLKRGYQPLEHGQMILNAYIDRHLENKLNHEEPPGAGLPVGGTQGCMARLKGYFITQSSKNENGQTQSIKSIPTEPAFVDNRWLIIELMNHHEDFSGEKAAQAREHEHFKRRTGYTYRPTNPKHFDGKDPNINTRVKPGLTELPKTGSNMPISSIQSAEEDNTKVTELYRKITPVI